MNAPSPARSYPARRDRQRHGPSGLALPREQERAGHRVTVVEEQETVAGRFQSVHVDGRAYDQ
ncbi:MULTISPECIES: FAD/NAD(P)-binding protein [unclassified Streptomyces]|uniref:NAD(P)-binding protein n=1 Tax=unclassified Streptomyces TaxID=2593676 RepID=UPI00225E4707|nr:MULTISPECIES: FAD/NAD(P)-binding protein [unclassified Streptomyces]